MKREITSARITIKAHADSIGENVVQRLRRRISQIQTSGTVVRTEWLDGQQASWCELRGVRTIILDASQPAAEQLGQLDEILTEIARISRWTSHDKSRRANRAA